MSQQSNIDTIRRGYAAFSAGDMDTLRNEVFTPDAVWAVPGNGYFSGAKEGVDAILQFFADTFERSGALSRSCSTTSPRVTTTVTRSTATSPCGANEAST